jgi:hypothetical protein
MQIARDMRKADLQEQDLSYRDLRGANLKGTNLKCTDMRETKLDFSCLSYCCGSFKMIVDDKFIIRLLSHISNLNIKHCSPELKSYIRGIPRQFIIKDFDGGLDGQKEEVLVYRNE